MAPAQQHAATGGLAPALLPKRKPIRPFSKKPGALRLVAPGLATVLGIRRVEIVRDRLNVLGDPMQRIGNNSLISLSEGDGADFSSWWKVICRPVVGPRQCRSPDGCKAHRMKKQSYCADHLMLYIAALPRPTGRPLLFSVARNRRRKPSRVAPAEG